MSARLKRKIRDAVESAYDGGMRHFICGMARGCDFYFAEAVLTLRREKGDVTLEAAIPCAAQSGGWPEADQVRWRSLLAQCDLETLSSDPQGSFSGRWPVKQQVLALPCIVIAPHCF
mgnify:CR=1 FL=1